MKLYISHSPAQKSSVSGRWYKSIKNRDSIGGKIFANVFGDTKEEAEETAKKIVRYWNSRLLTVSEIESKLLEIFNRAEVKEDIQQATKYIVSLLN